MATSAFTTSLTRDELAGYLTRLVANHLPDGRDPAYDLAPHVGTALERVEHSFSQVHRKYYNQGGSVRLDHLNGDHMSAFLYLVANSAWSATGDTELPTKLFALNKIMHGIDLFYSVRMPEVFFLVHPVGTVIGNAELKDYLVIYQNCTIGGDAGKYPSLGEGLIMYSGSTVLGDVTAGDNVVLAAGAFVINTDIPGDSVVVGRYPDHKALPSSRTVRERLFEA